MTERVVIAEFSRRYVVEEAEVNSYQYAYDGPPMETKEWRFVRAFDIESDALSHAERLAEDTRWVRVVDTKPHRSDAVQEVVDARLGLNKEQ